MIRGQETIAQEESKDHLELVADLMISIPKAFKDDFKDGHSIVIDLINDDIFEFNGDQYGPILEITAQDEQNPLSIYKGIFTLSNGSSLFVKLEFNFP